MNDYEVQENVRPGFDRLVDNTTRSDALIMRKGGELIGFTVKDPESGDALPLLWNNNSDAVPFEGAWKNHATVLFPIVGGLKGGQSRCGSDDIILPGNHGLARHGLFSLVSVHTENRAAAVYRFTHDVSTLEKYPFRFTLQLTYTLQGGHLSLAMQIENPGDRDMPYQCGWHPGFNTALKPGMTRPDWEVRFKEGPCRHYHVLDSGDSYLTGEVSERVFRGPLEFTDHELFCTLMYAIDDPARRQCRLVHSKTGYGIELTFADFPHVGLWANPGQEYLCIEPWQGMDDHVDQELFEEKVGLEWLKPGEKTIKRAVIRPTFP
jgi:galactose mutarotase-like enzyme